MMPNSDQLGVPDPTEWKCVSRHKSRRYAWLRRIPHVFFIRHLLLLHTHGRSHRAGHLVAEVTSGAIKWKSWRKDALLAEGRSEKDNRMERLLVICTIVLTGCANLAMGWYKPGGSQSAFAQDKYECMSNSQMAVSGAYVNAYGGAANSQTTTNMPLFQACMQARGYYWTSQAQVNKYEGRSSN